MNRKIVLAGFLLVSSLSGVGYNAYVDYNTLPVELKSGSFTYEYGDEISNNIGSYFKILDKDKVKETCKLKLPFENEDLVKVGSYKGKLSFRDEIISFEIKVKDTTKPEFVDFQEVINTEEGISSKDTILPLFKANDLSDVSVELDDSGVDYGKAGSYNLTVVAKDIWGNSSSRSAVVNVAPKRVEEVVTIVSKDEENRNKKSSNFSSSPNTYSSSKEEISYPCITIPGVVNNQRVYEGSIQQAVDTYNICLMTEAMGRPGEGRSILMGGHRNKVLGRLYTVSVGSLITYNTGSTVYTYRVTDSLECTTSGQDLTSIFSGKNMLEYSKREVLQIYTCYGSGNHRWLVKAVRVN